MKNLSVICGRLVIFSDFLHKKTSSHDITEILLKVVKKHPHYPVSFITAINNRSIYWYTQLVDKQVYIITHLVINILNWFIITAHIIIHMVKKKVLTILNESVIVNMEQLYYF